MKHLVWLAACCGCVVTLLVHVSAGPPAAGANGSWNAKAAAAYLDGRADWWEHWPVAARDHGTACVSCHTAVPYAIARPALRAPLGETAPTGPEQAIFSGVVKRVGLWREVEPFYPDQTRGLPKTSESRGTEAILNALVLAARDRRAGSLSDDARLAFSNLWPLQFKAGELKGAWAWLNFHYEPWESPNAPFFGATLAALAVGMAPDHYAASPDIQPNVALLGEYLRAHVESESLFNRLMALWSSGGIPELLAPSQKQAIVDRALGTEQSDGGWAMAKLGTWRRLDSTPIDDGSDGYATALAVLALRHSGMPSTDPAVSRGREWLAHHQDAASGAWKASSLNKQRDPATDAGKFMSDAATAYAVLALSADRW